MLKISLRAGKVLEIKGDKIKVELFSDRLPQACNAKGCNACKSYFPQITRYYPFSGEIEVGDIVRIENRPINEGIAAMAVFLVPILFSALFYYLSDKSSENILSVALAVLGIVFGFALVALFDKIFRILNPSKIIKEQ